MQGGRTRFLRGLAARLGTLLASCIFALLLAEGILRLTASGRLNSPRHFVWPPGLSAVFTPDPAIMPGIHGRSRFAASSLGLRADEIPAGPSYRVLAIGGSTTECLFLDQTETWPYRLQQKLSEAAPGRPVWVGNAGKSGLTTRDHVVQLKYLLAELPRLDAVVFLVGVNDLSLRNLQDARYDPDFMARERSEGWLLPRAFGRYPLTDTTLPWHRRRLLWELGRQANRRLRAAANDMQDAAGQNYSRWRAERRAATRLRETLPDLRSALGEYRQNLSRLIELARQREVRPIFLTQPTVWRDDLPPEFLPLLWVGRIGEGRDAEYYSVPVLATQMKMYNDTLLETCRERGVECFDLAARVPRDATVFYDDDHYNEGGAELVAELVAGFLRERPPFRAAGGGN